MVNWWIIILIVIVAFFGYLNYTDTKIDFGNLKNSVINTFQSNTQSENEDPSIKICRENLKERLDIMKTTAIIDISYSIKDIKEFYSFEEAEEYRDLYTSLYMDSFCEEGNLSKIISIRYEIMYPSGYIEPLARTKIDKESRVVLCDENGEFLETGLFC